ncbi:unnamed protein product [[Candida] boidinii]|nr:unnamed protein product [[Candida] boidinii]
MNLKTIQTQTSNPLAHAISTIANSNKPPPPPQQAQAQPPALSAQTQSLPPMFPKNVSMPSPNLGSSPVAAPINNLKNEFNHPNNSSTSLLPLRSSFNSVMPSNNQQHTIKWSNANS